MMGVPVFPKLPSSDFMPGLEDQHVMGAAGVGVNVITATIACNTAMTAAELVVNAGNYSTNLGAVGPIIHSLGKTPTWVDVRNWSDGDPNTAFMERVHFQYLTADNSAVYIYARSTSGATLLGTAVQVACWP